MTRGMKKRENENLTPGWLTEISEPVSLAQLEAGAGQGFTLDQASTKMLPPRARTLAEPARPADGARARARRGPGQGLDGGGLVRWPPRS